MVMPISDSSSESALERDGCAMKRREAAADMEPAFATSIT